MKYQSHRNLSSGLTLTGRGHRSWNWSSHRMAISP